MLIYDAITGNFDRHMYNWGVVINTSGKKQPYFSPIYDTARGLFWNYSEEQLIKWQKYRQLPQQIEKYAKDSKPKITLERQPDINHFEFVKCLFNEEVKYQSLISHLISDQNRQQIFKLLEIEFRYLCSEVRLEAIKQTIQFRFDYLNKTLQQ